MLRGHDFLPSSPSAGLRAPPASHRYPPNFSHPQAPMQNALLIGLLLLALVLIGIVLLQRSEGGGLGMGGGGGAMSQRSAANAMTRLT